MRILVRLAAGLATLLASVALGLIVFLLGTYFQVRGALPPYAGQLEAKGLKAPIEILRDRNAVPHIIAGSIEDAAFGLGFVSAVFDNIPLTALALKQGGYDWGFLAFAVGFGGSMMSMTAGVVAVIRDSLPARSVSTGYADRGRCR